MFGQYLITFATVSTLLIFSLISVPSSYAQAKGKAAREVAEYLIRKFGKEAAEETVESLTRRLERLVLRHGDEVLEAVEKGGFRALFALEKTAERSPQLVKLLIRYGDEAVWIVERPRSTAIFLKHGDDAARALIKHGEIAEPVIEQLGQPAAKTLANLSNQQARRLAIMANNGDLAKIGRTTELLEVVTKHPDPTWADAVMDFIWRHKGALAVSAALAAFLADPEPFINGVKDITKIAAENTVGKVAEEAARQINWTLIILALMTLGAALIFIRLYLNHRRRGSSPQQVA